MSKDRDNTEKPHDSKEDWTGFGLTRPTGEFDDVSRKSSSESTPKSRRDGSRTSPLNPEPIEKSGASTTAWKGFETEEDFEHEVAFTREKDKGNEDMDMTPMVDVTFLLLIFFMVTASFTLQKSIEQPASKSEDPSTAFIEVEDNEEFVQIIIDQYNTYRLTSRHSEEVEAASDNEMRRRLKDMVESTRAKKLIILHHGDATHEKVVTAWDAGNFNRIEDIVTQLTEVDF